MQLEMDSYIMLHPLQSVGPELQNYEIIGARFSG
jgi:hypothetical protein